MFRQLKLLSIIILTLSLSSNSFAEEMSLTIINKFFQDGNKVCQEEGYGEYLLTDNPIKLIDISNDGIKDIIIESIRMIDHIWIILMLNRTISTYSLFCKYTEIGY